MLIALVMRLEAGAFTHSGLALGPLHSLVTDLSALICAGGRSKMAQVEYRPINGTPQSGVRNHARYLGVVGVRNQRGMSKFALGLGLLRRQDVAHLRLAAHDLAGGSLLEALGCAFMGLKFRHGCPTGISVFTTSPSIRERG